MIKLANLTKRFESRQAQAVVDYCNGKDPCNVVIIIGHI